MSTCKETNPKDAMGVKKVPFSVIPFTVLHKVSSILETNGVDFPYPVLPEVGVAMLEGALKYGRHNYRASGVRASVYFDAFMRHMVYGYLSGELIDDESGLSHVTKAIASLLVLSDAILLGNWTDDRPPINTQLLLSHDNFYVTPPELANSAVSCMVYWWETDDRISFARALAYLFVLRDKIGVDLPSLQPKVDALLAKYPNPKEAVTR